MLLEQVVHDANWYLHGIDLDRATCSFVKTDRHALTACSFLDHRFKVDGLEKVTFSITDLVRESSTIESAAPVFIFHTAFCCSTLISRCLDYDSANVSLKEPGVLMALANYQRIGHPLLSNHLQAQAIYTLVSKLLFRPFAPNQRVLVKPTNTVNNVIIQLMRADSRSKALLLHSDLESFLISILKKGEEGKGFARQLFTIFLMDSPEARQLDSTRLLRMTDTQIAAMTWHLQFEHFIDAFAGLDQSQLRSLHCDRLLDDPHTFLLNLINFFDLDVLQQNFESVFQSAPLTSNSKTPDQQYGAKNRTHEYESARARFEQELKLIVPWAKNLSFKHKFAEILPNSI